LDPGTWDLPVFCRAFFLGRPCLAVPAWRESPEGSEPMISRQDMP